MVSLSPQLPSLPRLAVELQLYILNFLESAYPELDEDDELPDCRPPVSRTLLNLSSTCKWYRDLLAPRVFQTLCLRNTAKSALSVRAVAKGKYAECVEELWYVGTCNVEQEEGPLQDVYPQELHDLLPNLASHFPKLGKLSVDFPFDYDNSDMMIDYLQDDVFNPSYDDALVQEDVDAWRGLMANSFNAISQNFSHTRNENDCAVPQIHSFDIQNFNIVPISTLYTDTFQKSLSLLKTFKFSLIRWDNGAGWCLNTQGVFRGFPPYLEPWFLSNLSSVEDLTFDPRRTSILGGGPTIPYSIDIPLGETTMPKLRIITIQNVFICETLIDFFTRHSNTLESITLGDCYGVHDSADPLVPVFWHELFDPLAEMARSEQKLTSLNLSFDDEKLSFLGLSDKWIVENHWDSFRPVEAKVQKEPDTPAFPYAEVDIKYGSPVWNEFHNAESFMKGWDYSSYLKLKGFVDDNADAKGVTRSTRVIYKDPGSDHPEAE